VFHRAHINAMYVALALLVISMTLGAIVTLVFMHNQQDAQNAAWSSGGVAAVKSNAGATITSAGEAQRDAWHRLLPTPKPTADMQWTVRS